MIGDTISAVVPTIGRAESLRNLLESLMTQQPRPIEAIVADGSDNRDVAAVVGEARWAAGGLTVTHLRVTPPNAVRQRQAAITASRGSLLLLLDDDVVLEADCLAAMLHAIAQPGVIAVTADFSNQQWSGPTVLWRWVLRSVYGCGEGEWQGRVIGPLLRFGYRPSPTGTVPMEWLGAGNSLIRRDAYEAAGGFSDFFLHRSTINEDVDLGLKLRRVGLIVMSPKARMAHLHAPHGRVSASVAAEDDLYNRYLILRRTLGKSAIRAFALVCFYFTIETAGNVGGSVFRAGGGGFFDRLGGRLSALARILRPDRRTAS
jgi:GT2 family glycosyltransferase